MMVQERKTKKLLRFRISNTFPVPVAIWLKGFKRNILPQENSLAALIDQT